MSRCRGDRVAIDCRFLALSTALALLAPLPAVAEAPMSAIDWLSSSVSPAALPPSASLPVLPPMPGEAPVSAGLNTEAVSVLSLDTPSADALGLLPAARTGLPHDLWGATPEVQLAAMLRKERLDTLPVIQGFLMELLLAELDPPAERAAEGRNVLFLARIDRLLNLGALEQAMALTEQVKSTDPEIFRRQFDVALLLGEEDRGCEIMASTPVVAPSFPARIFCLARRGDWNAAMLSFETGRALGQIDSAMAALIERFLDAELADGAEDLPPPNRPSPLTFRLMEAIGQPMSTTTLPVAFAQADLRANSGWKAQIEAAERLTRMGVLDPNQLLGLYTQERASASGGVWSRVSVISELDAVVSSGDSARVARVLPTAWAAMQDQEMEPALAAMFAEPLGKMALEGEAGRLAFRLALLTPAFETAALARRPADLDEKLLVGLARGQTAGVPAQDQLGLVLKRVFDAMPATVPEPYQALVPGRLGEALLAAIDDISEGAKGDYRRLEAGLMMLRAAGLERVARRAALELVVLERRG